MVKKEEDIFNQIIEDINNGDICKILEIEHCYKIQFDLGQSYRVIAEVFSCESYNDIYINAEKYDYERGWAYKDISDEQAEVFKTIVKLMLKSGAIRCKHTIK